MRLRDYDYQYCSCPVAAVKRMSLIEFEKYPPPKISRKTKGLVTDHLNGQVPADKNWLKFKGKQHKLQ